MNKCEKGVSMNKCENVLSILKEEDDGKTIKLNFYADPGHGWLEVPVALFKESGAVASPYSYFSKKRGMCYLEEDSDAPKFEDAITKLGYTLDVKYIVVGDDNFIRKLGRM